MIFGNIFCRKMKRNIGKNTVYDIANFIREYLEHYIIYKFKTTKILIYIEAFAKFGYDIICFEIHLRINGKKFNLGNIEVSGSDTLDMNLGSRKAKEKIEEINK